MHFSRLKCKLHCQLGLKTCGSFASPSCFLFSFVPLPWPKHLYFCLHSLRCSWLLSGRSPPAPGCSLAALWLLLLSALCFLLAALWMLLIGALPKHMMRGIHLWIPHMRYQHTWFCLQDKSYSAVWSPLPALVCCWLLSGCCWLLRLPRPVCHQ
jgi:hypothetical protein